MVLRVQAIRPYIVCIFLLTILAACSSVGRTTVGVQKAHVIEPGASAVLAIKSSVRKPGRYQGEAESRLRSQLSTGLVNAGVFRTISGSAEDADYRIVVRIDKVRIRAVATRIWLGAFAARSVVAVHVDVHQAKTGRLITSFDTSGYGGRTAIGAQSYGIDDPIREVVAQVIGNLQ